MIRPLLRLFSMNLAAQVLVLAGSLVLPYLYAPEDFAAFAVFSSAALLLGQCLHLRFQDALRLVEDKGSVVAASLVVTIFGTGVILIYSPLLAAGALSVALFGILYAVHSDRRDYAAAGRLRLGRALGLVGVQLGAFRLPLALEAGYVLANLLPCLGRARWCRPRLSVATVVPLVPFALLRTTGTAVAFAAQLLPLLSVRHAYAVPELSAFAFADKLVGAAVAAISTPLETVLYQELSASAVARSVHHLLRATAGLLGCLGLGAGLCLVPGVATFLPVAWQHLPATLALVLPTLAALVVISLVTRLLGLINRPAVATALNVAHLSVRTLPFLAGLRFETALAVFSGASVLLAFASIALLRLPPRALRGDGGAA
ncbi:MAG: hypothetical protein AB7O57_16800 [Hyphomicrobiaceae bacterium]